MPCRGLGSAPCRTPHPSPCPVPTLPVPDADARAHSARVVAHARAELAAAGGWIPLADYLQHVLYAPGLGYYAAGARKFGAAGDFVTAPEMTPLFGAALAVQVDAVLAATAAARSSSSAPAPGASPRTCSARSLHARRCRRATRSSR